MQPLGQPLHQPGDADLVDHLGHLPGARFSEPAAELGVGVDHRLGGLDRRPRRRRTSRRAGHFRPGLPAGDRRVDEGHVPARPGNGVQFARDLCRHGGVIDERRPRPCPRTRRPAPRQTLRRSSSLPTQAITKSAPCGRLARGRLPGPAMTGHPGLRLGVGAVVDRHLVACPGEVTGHRTPHHPSPRNASFAMRLPPSLSRVARQAALGIARQAKCRASPT